MIKTYFPNPIDSEDLICIHEGKVRNTYIVEKPDLLCIVATDRVSTYNMVHNSVIPHKGEVLTFLTIYWLTDVLEKLPNHLVAYGSDIYKYLPEGMQKKYPDLHYRALIVKKLDMIPVEFVIRQYLTGSLYKNYILGKDPHNVQLMDNLPKMHRFSSPLFTPTDKSDTDEPLPTFMVKERYWKASALVEEAFLLAAQKLTSKGLTLVDSKLELGYCRSTGELLLADELFTPDSSRFAETDKIREGEDPPWFDKQRLRDAAETIWQQQEFGPLSFSEALIDDTSALYRALLPKITEYTLLDWKDLLN